MHLQKVAKDCRQGWLRLRSLVLAIEQVIRDGAGYVALRDRGPVDCFKVALVEFQRLLPEPDQCAIYAIKYVPIV